MIKVENTFTLARDSYCRRVNTWLRIVADYTDLALPLRNGQIIESRSSRLNFFIDPTEPDGLQVVGDGVATALTFQSVKHVGQWTTAIQAYGRDPLEDAMYGGYHPERWLDAIARVRIQQVHQDGRRQEEETAVMGNGSVFHRLFVPAKDIKINDPITKLDELQQTADQAMATLTAITSPRTPS